MRFMRFKQLTTLFTDCRRPSTGTSNGIPSPSSRTSTPAYPTQWSCWESAWCCGAMQSRGGAASRTSARTAWRRCQVRAFGACKCSDVHQCMWALHHTTYCSHAPLQRGALSPAMAASCAPTTAGVSAGTASAPLCPRPSTPRPMPPPAPAPGPAQSHGPSRCMLKVRTADFTSPWHGYLTPHRCLPSQKRCCRAWSLSGAAPAPVLLQRAARSLRAACLIWSPVKTGPCAPQTEESLCT